MRINKLEPSFNEEDLWQACYGDMCPLLTKAFSGAIEEICDANRNVDYKRTYLSFAHFDCERFDKSQKWITNLTKVIVYAFKVEDYGKAWSYAT